MNTARKLSPSFSANSWQHINDTLLAQGLINQESFNLLFKKKIAGIHPLQVIALEKIPNEKTKRPWTLEQLTEWMANWCQLPYLKIDLMKIKLDQVGHVVPPAYAKRLQILPIEVDGEKAIIGTANPFELSWIPELSRVIKRKIEVVVCNPQDIANYIEQTFSVHKAVRKARIENRAHAQDEKISELDSLIKFGQRRGNMTSEDSSVGRIVEWLFKYAFDERASDIHLEPRDDKGRIRFRIDGKLRQVYALEPEVMLPVLSRLKLIGKMAIDEKRRPQDGRVKLTLNDDQNMEIRMSTVPTHYGEKLVMRIFDPEIVKKNFNELGFYENDLVVWNELISHEHGMILVTGPTGSGKTTTLYSSLKQIAVPEVNVCTVEDPIEMAYEEINQVQVNNKIEVTFANAVRSFLRQDPDVIMVGEIRDKEVAQMAIQASLTGHLVLSTLHTNSALASVTRLLDLGIPDYLINSTLIGILAQRLVRVLCPHCKESVPTPESKWKTLVGEFDLAMPEKIYTNRGCLECKETGYMGRVCIYELVPITNEIKKFINNDIELHNLVESTKGTFTPMNINGAKRVLEGTTSIEEVLQVVVRY